MVEVRGEVKPWQGTDVPKNGSGILTCASNVDGLIPMARASLSARLRSAGSGDDARASERTRERREECDDSMVPPGRTEKARAGASADAWTATQRVVKRPATVVNGWKGMAWKCSNPAPSWPRLAAKLPAPRRDPTPPG